MIFRRSPLGKGEDAVNWVSRTVFEKPVKMGEIEAKIIELVAPELHGRRGMPLDDPKQLSRPERDALMARTRVLTILGQRGLVPLDVRDRALRMPLGTWHELDEA